MSTLKSTAVAFLLASCLAFSQEPLSKEAIQGTFASGPYVLRLHQVGGRVCGEWSYVTQRTNREGLVAGTETRGELLLTQCEEFELSCKPGSDPTVTPQKFVLKKGHLERVGGNGDGSNEVFRRLDGNSPTWSNAQASQASEFLQQCKW